MRSKYKGFTLIELIVVIAIVGILAAILVPSIMGYVRKSKLRAANLNAKNAFSALNNAATDLACEGQISSIIKHSPVAVTSLNENDDLEGACRLALDNNGIHSGYVCWDVNAEKKIICAQWASSMGTKDYVGQYPNPADDADMALTTLGNLINSSKWTDETRPDLT